MNEALLVIDRIHKQFGPRTVLDIETLVLRTGCSYALSGDNGAGKTTLLRVMAGLESAQFGSGHYLGRAVDLCAYPAWLRRDVIYVHQHPYLFRTSVKDNIAYGLKVRGATWRERERLVLEAVDWAGVGHLLDSPVQKLSAGEKQRVALARARVLKPRLFLLDEPTANLDTEAREQTIALIGDLCDANGTAVIACHDREILQMPGMCRLHLAAGRIEQHEGNGTLIAGGSLASPRRRSSGRAGHRVVGAMQWRPVAND